MAENKEKYDGDYKVGLSDQGRISFNLNWKWAVSITITILGFVLYLLIDKYHTQPMESLRIENSRLKEKIDLLEETNGKAINTLTNNQGILLDRSERTQKFIDMWYDDLNDNQPAIDAQPLEHNLPGN